MAGCLAAAGAFALSAPIDLPGDRMFPENIAATVDGTLYVGSLGSGGIIRVKPNSTQAESLDQTGFFREWIDFWCAGR